METGLVLALPDLDRPLRRWRRHDPAARQGMPAHVTLIYPFMDSRAVDDAVRLRLRDALTAFGPLEMVFDQLGRFSGGVWLEPVDPVPVKQMINALAAAFPAHPPYGGAFAEVTAHLTVAQGPETLLEAMSSQIPRVLPLAAQARAVSLFARFEDGWVPVERFALTGRSRG